jgi:oligopeptide/dipeptide ABC transporter ATP-binding protein
VNLREEFLDRYPHEFSGGQAQRIGIARALAAEARILILDEPVSALDVSVQAQVLNLLADLKAKFGLTYLFISHDLAVVEAVSDRVAVLYFGAVVEVGPAAEIFANPRHPYTKLLADSAPVVGRALKAPEGRETELPDPLNPPTGCAFRARCPRAVDRCALEVPTLTAVSDATQAACFNPGDLRRAPAPPQSRPGFRDAAQDFGGISRFIRLASARSRRLRAHRHRGFVRICGKCEELTRVGGDPRGGALRRRKDLRWSVQSMPDPLGSPVANPIPLVVIPCLNEAEHVARVARQMCAAVARHGGLVVVVDGGSTDRPAPSAPIWRARRRTCAFWTIPHGGRPAP